jgi:hypothetical protein
MNHQGSSFTCGCAPHTDLIFFAKTDDELAEQGKSNGIFFAMDGDDWIKFDEIVNWNAISIATVGSGDGRYLLAISLNGDFWELENVSGIETLGRLSADDLNPRTLAVIDQSIYAVGMDRMVMRREGLDRWSSIGPRPATEAESIIGFEDMAGYSKDEMYAVGWQGEIWWYDHAQWRQIDSPASANFNATCCAEDGTVYIVGDNGAMLRGRHDTWEVIESGRDENLMDVCYYENNVYVVTDFQILKLKGDVLVGEGRFVDTSDVPTTCLYLLKASDGVVSMGPKDLFRLTQDGWERLV